MGKLVSRDEVKGRLLDYTDSVDDTKTLSMVVGRIVENVKTVDAVPVVHGRWVKVPGYATPGGDPVWRCSECGKGVHVYGIEHGTYGAEIADGQWVSCPNCGARMDGEGE